MQRFDKRLKAIKARDPLLQFLNELEADGSRAARDFLMSYARTVKSAEYRARAFEALTKIGGAKAMAFLCGKDGVRAADFAVQHDAIEALSKSGDKACVEPLLAVLSDPAVKIENVGAICITLAKIAPGDPKVEAALFKEAADKRDTVRANAVEGLGRVGSDKAYAFLPDELKNDKNTRCRAAAATGLGHTKRQEAIPALQAAAAEDKSESVRNAAIQSLKDLGATGR